MKLIIEIPEGEYGTIKQFEKLGKYSDKNDVGQRTLSRIANGIPLEQIRDEIEDCKQYQFETYGIQRYFKIDDIRQIIDKYRGDKE